MQSYQIITNHRENRLHVIFEHGFSNTDVDAAIFKLRAAIKKLRPGFSITVSHDISTFEPPLPTRKKSGPSFSMRRHQGQVSRVLRALDTRQVA